MRGRRVRCGVGQTLDEGCGGAEQSPGVGWFTWSRSPAFLCSLFTIRVGGERCRAEPVRRCQGWRGLLDGPAARTRCRGWSRRGFAIGASAWSFRWWAGPFRGDDDVELGRQQLFVGEEQVEELLVGAAWVVRAVGVQDRGHGFHTLVQALMACRSP